MPPIINDRFAGIFQRLVFFINYGDKQIDIGLGKSKKSTITLHTKLDLGIKKKGNLHCTQSIKVGFWIEEISIVHKVGLDGKLKNIIPTMG